MKKRKGKSWSATEVDDFFDKFCEEVRNLLKAKSKVSPDVVQWAVYLPGWFSLRSFIPSHVPLHGPMGNSSTAFLSGTDHPVVDFVSTRAWWARVLLPLQRADAGG